MGFIDSSHTTNALSVTKAYKISEKIRFPPKYFFTIGNFDDRFRSTLRGTLQKVHPCRWIPTNCPLDCFVLVIVSGLANSTNRLVLARLKIHKTGLAILGHIMRTKE